MELLDVNFLSEKSFEPVFSIDIGDGRKVEIVYFENSFIAQIFDKYGRRLCLKTNTYVIQNTSVLFIYYGSPAIFMHQFSSFVVNSLIVLPKENPESFGCVVGIVFSDFENAQKFIFEFKDFVAKEEKDGRRVLFSP